MGKLQMTELLWADGILLADPPDIPPVMPGIAYHIMYWRPTWGGKVLAVLDYKPCDPGVDLLDTRFSWPMVPVRKWPFFDCWYTGTIDPFTEQLEYHVWECFRLLRPEVNMRKPINGTERVSRRVAHRVIWADRTSGHLVTDPLYRKTFVLYDEALNYLRERERAQRERAERVLAEEPF